MTVDCECRAISEVKVISLPSVFDVDLFFGARDQVDKHSLCTSLHLVLFTLLVLRRDQRNQHFFVSFSQ